MFGFSKNEKLFKAIENKNLDTIKFLISKGADVNTKDKYGDTPLHDSSNSGHLMISTFLIEKGADININNKNGETPLHKSAYHGHFEVAELLINKGANINAVDIANLTPLNFAIWGLTSLEALLSELVPNEFVKQQMQGFIKTIEILIKNGADVNAKNKDGNTPLKWAILAKKAGLVELFRKNGGHE